MMYATNPTCCIFNPPPFLLSFSYSSLSRRYFIDQFAIAIDLVTAELKLVGLRWVIAHKTEYDVRNQSHMLHFQSSSIFAQFLIFVFIQAVLYRSVCHCDRPRNRLAEAHRPAVGDRSCPLRRDR